MKAKIVMKLKFIKLLKKLVEVMKHIGKVQHSLAGSEAGGNFGKAMQNLVIQLLIRTRWLIILRILTHLNW